MLKHFFLKATLLLFATAFLFLNNPLTSYSQDSLRDLSGTWVGTQINGNLVMYYEICMKRTGQNTYAGYDYCKWQRNKNNAPLNIPGEKPHAKKVFTGSFDGEVFSFSEIGNIEHSNWGLLNEQLKLIEGDGSPELWDNDKSQPARKFHLTRTSDSFPQEYVKYANPGSLLKIDNLSYNNPGRATHMKYNESGQIAAQIENTTDIDFNKLDIVVSAREQGSVYMGNNAAKNSFSIKSNTRQQQNAEISTDFSLPRDSIRLEVSVNANGVSLAKKYLALSSESFFKTETVAPVAYTTPRMKAVAAYYGFLDNPYSDASKQLDPLVSAGDKIAGMWKAIFMYMGIGGYKPDEDMALGLGRDNIKAVENNARTGDAESIFLMYYACQMGLEGRKAKSSATGFLEMSAHSGFKPALYDFALYSFLKKDFGTCSEYLLKSFAMGVKKSALTIGIMYEKGYLADKNIDSALEWYKAGINFGDPDAMYRCAILYGHGDDRGPAIDKSIELAINAAEKHCPGAMLYVANLYLYGSHGMSKNIPSSLKWFKEAARYGDREAMFALAAIYTDGDLQGVAKDEKSAFPWAKKAAELGQPQAMKMLAKFYNDGNVVGKDVIKSRYWFNQCALIGEASREDVNTTSEDFLNIWRYADFSPGYYYVDSYGNYLGEGEPDLFGGLLTGFLGSYFESRMRTQPMINGLEYIQNKNGKKIYGGTITSLFVSGVELQKGETVQIKAYGAVTLGWMLSNIPADGISNPMYAIYSIVPGINHGAVMVGMNNYWQFIGRSGSYSAPQEGRLSIAINDADYTNNQGYFDIVVEVNED